jgi:type IV secretion system protein VirB4
MTFSASEIRALTRGEAPKSKHIPFGALVAPDVCKLRGKTAYCATWRVAGVSFETSTPQVVGNKFDYLASVYRSLGGGELSYWYHRIGRSVRQDLTHHEFDGFAKRIDDKYSAWQNDRGFSLFESYLTLVYYPPSTRLKKPWFSKKDADARVILEEQEAALKAFNEICLRAEGQLKEFMPQRLGAYQRRGREYSELATFYGFLVNGVWREEPFYLAPLSRSLPSSFMHFGDLNGRMEINDGPDKRFVGLLEIVDYPPTAIAGDLDAVLGLGVEFIETHSFSTLYRHDALRALERQANQLTSGEEASKAELEMMNEAIEEVRDGRIVGGTYHFSLALFGRNLIEVQKACASVRREVATYKLEDSRIVPEGSWYAQLPGNWEYRPRTAFMTSRNFAGLAPLHTHPTGKAYGNPWGEAVTILRGSANQPFAFNFHATAEDMDRLDAKDPGNTVVFGMIGSGKTAFVMFLLAQAQRFHPRVLVLDKDRGTEIAVRAFGGSYTVFQRGVPTGINPFQWPDSPDTRSLCRKVVQACVKRGDQVLDARSELAISAAVDSVFESVPLGQRRLAAVDSFLPAGHDENWISTALRKWIGDGHLAWVLDSESDNLEIRNHRIFGIDYTVFLDDEEIRGPVMLVLMALRDSLITGEYFISVMDEFWKAYSVRELADDDKNKLKTGRKTSMLNIMMSQSVSDAMDHEHARTVVEQTPTKIFLPNPEATYKEYVQDLGLNEREFELIKNFGQFSRSMLVRQGQRSVVINGDLSGLSEEMIALSGSLDNVKLLDEIRREHGDDPQIWFPLLVQAVQARKARRNAAA